MTKESITLYTTAATATGGREGSVRTDDGRLEANLDLPKKLGGTGGPGTNPEQLFAAGWAACFLSALHTVASGKADLSSAHLTVTISILKSPAGEFDLAAILDLDPTGSEGADPVELIRAAHAICPYSRATRGNIDVVLKLAGVALDAPSVA